MGQAQWQAVSAECTQGSTCLVHPPQPALLPTFLAPRGRRDGSARRRNPASFHGKACSGAQCGALAGETGWVIKGAGLAGHCTCHGRAYQAAIPSPAMGLVQADFVHMVEGGMCTACVSAGCMPCSEWLAGRGGQRARWGVPLQVAGDSDKGCVGCGCEAAMDTTAELWTREPTSSPAVCMPPSCMGRRSPKLPHTYA